jgi:hypothetical protein
MRKILMSLAVALAAALVGGAVVVADPGSPITCRAIESVKVGMTRAQVEEVLGRTDMIDEIYEPVSTQKVAGHALFYRWSPRAASAWTDTTTVHIRDGRVAMVIWDKYLFQSFAGRMLRERARVGEVGGKNESTGRQETLLFSMMHRCG